jgi:hypothetical protein
MSYQDSSHSGLQNVSSTIRGEGISGPNFADGDQGTITPKVSSNK